MTKPPSRAPTTSVAGVPLLQQLVEALELTLVVAQNQGRRAAGEQPTQPAEIPVYGLGRQESGLEIGPLLAETEPRKFLDPGLPLRGLGKEVLSRRRRLPEPPGDLQVVLRLAPRPGDLLRVGVGGLFDEERVGGEKVEESA